MPIRNHCSLPSKANKSVRCICLSCNQESSRVYKGIEEQFGPCAHCGGKLIDFRRVVEERKLNKARREYEEVMAPFVASGSDSI